MSRVAVYTLIKDDSLYVRVLMAMYYIIAHGVSLELFGSTGHANNLSRVQRIRERRGERHYIRKPWKHGKTS
eukprot:scaffold4736_cov105-Cylindrotheca_fusiformis.AAC.3